MILTEEIENSLKNEADIIRKSGLERTYAYKIIRGEKGKNAKDKIYRLALAMN